MSQTPAAITTICTAQPGTRVTIISGDRRKQREPIVAPVVAFAVVLDAMGVDGRPLARVQPVFIHEGTALVPDQLDTGLRFEVQAP
ncbi:hypothetical protein ACQP2K_30625 [Microbispora siamensis]